MILLAILSVFTVALAGPRPVTRPWANEDRFGPYQRAWASLNESIKALYFLTNTTYENDELTWGAGFKCVVVKEVNRSADGKEVTSKFAFKNNSIKETTYTSVEKVKAVFQYNYTQYENAIRYVVNDTIKYTDTLIFTDDNCDIFDVPYANSWEGGLELWVKEAALKNIPQHCYFLVEYFRKAHHKVYPKYDPESCKDVKKKLEENI